jgi:hypothetical protein
LAGALREEKSPLGQEHHSIPMAIPIARPTNLVGIAIGIDHPVLIRAAVSGRSRRLVRSAG